MTTTGKNRPFEEVLVEREQSANATFRHFTNGYQHIHFKESGTTLEQIWFLGFVAEDLEIEVRQGVVSQFYSVSVHSIDPLKFRHQEIMEKHRTKSNLATAEVTRRLKTEIGRIVPASLRQQIQAELAF